MGASHVPATVFLIRHAEDVPASGPYGVHDSNPLTDLGREQAERLALTLKDDRLDAIYAAVSVRTFDTAAPIAREVGLSVVPVPGLYHRTLREGLTGVRRLDNVVKWLSFRVLMGLGPLSMVEPISVHHPRNVREIQRIAIAHPGQQVAIVAFRPTIHALAGAAHVHDHRLPPLASISEIEADGASVRMVRFADTRHLAGLPATYKA